MHKAKNFLRGAIAIALAATLAIPIAIATTAGAATPSAGGVLFDSAVVDDVPADDAGAGADVTGGDVGGGNGAGKDAASNEIDATTDAGAEIASSIIAKLAPAPKNAKEVSPDTAIKITAIGQGVITQGDEQQIPIMLADESATIKQAELTITHVASRETKTIQSTENARYAANFLFSTKTWQLGQWQVMRFTCTTERAATFAEGADTITVDLTTSEDMVFKVEGPQGIGEKSSDGAVETSVMVVDENKTVEVGSLDEAIEIAEEEVASTTYSARGADNSAADSSTTYSSAASSRAGVLTIGLDAGHYNADSGAIINNGSVTEVSMTKKITQYCAEELSQYQGVRVVQSNGGGLTERVINLQSKGAQVIVCMHINALGVPGKYAYGAEVFYQNQYGNGVSPTSKALAQSILNELVGLGLKNRGVKIKDSEKNFYAPGQPIDYLTVLHEAKLRNIPAVLVEHAFIDSSDYNNFLNSDAKLKNLGVADATGIAKYFGLAKWSWSADVTSENLHNGKVRVTIDGSDCPAGIVNVSVPTWGAENGQNDVIWHRASRQANGDWIADIPIAEHKELGTYHSHVYASMSTGPTKYVGATSYTIKSPRSSVSVESVDADAGSVTFKATVDAENGVGSVSLPTWCSTVGGQDDLIWYALKPDAGATSTHAEYTLTVNMSNHRYQAGDYQAHLYAYDAVGFCSVSTTSEKLSLPPMQFATPIMNGTSVTLKASGGALGIARGVSFPTWSDAGGHDDLVWYGAQKDATGTWVATVDLKRHRTAGRYTVHIYANFEGVTTAIGSTTFTVTAPTATIAVVSTDADEGSITYKATVKAPLGTGNVSLPTWCATVGGQDDLLWYAMSKDTEEVQNGVPTVTYSLKVFMANHRYQVGDYVAHLYAYDASGICAPVSEAKQALELPPTKISATYGGSGTFNLRASGGALATARGLSFPTWSDAGGQDDLIWYGAKQDATGAWVAVVPVSRHKTAGSYSVHTYANLNGKSIYIGATSFSVTAPTSTLEITGTDARAGSVSYKAIVKAPLGIGSVSLPTWCSTVGGQDDLQWYPMNRASYDVVDGVPTATYTLTVYMANHRYQAGNYSAHLYAYDAAGISTGVKAAEQKLELPPMTIEASESGSATYTLKASGGALATARSLSFPTWSDKGGQDDLIWYAARKDATGAWVAVVPVSRHKTAGAYTVHTYADLVGRNTYIGATSFEVEAPEATLTVKAVDQEAATITYEAVVQAAFGVANASLPVWCSSTGGQDDLIWHAMSRTASTATSATFSTTVKMTDHRFQTGTYTAHLYAYDTAGILAFAKVDQQLNFPSTTTTADSNITSVTRALSIKGKFLDSATSVSFPTWSDAGGQDDVVWYPAAKSSTGTWVASVPLTNHKQVGNFTVHVYANFNDTLISVGATSFYVDPTIITSLGYAIMGKSACSVDQMVALYNAKSVTGSIKHFSYPTDDLGPKGASNIREFCTILVEEAQAEGVRAEVLFAQSMLETGWLQSEFCKKRCNFGGLGAVDSNPTAANTFVNVRTGLRAQVQHLRAYADPTVTKDKLAYECEDVRFNYVSPKGKAQLVEHLSGKWASDLDYGTKILNIIGGLHS